jgi:prefoldin subunit 5
MASIGSKGDTVPARAILKALEAVRSLQQGILKIDARLQQVEAVIKDVAETHKQLDDKMDSIYKLIQQWNSSSEYGN